MIRCGANVAILHQDTPQPLGVFETPAVTSRQVYCTVRTVSYRERYEAGAHGLRPEYIIRLADAAEYQDETRCTIEGQEFRIMHPWANPDGSVELTLERRAAP